MVAIAESSVARRGHHASLVMWCGGNELHRAVGEGAARRQIPADLSHPMLHALAETVSRRDPGRRFVATSPSGPRFFGDPADFGKGVHWDVHGPWRPDAGLEEWQQYWDRDDALLRSEVGCPGASPPGILHDYCAPEAFTRPTADGPRFRRQFDGWWWMEWARFEQEHGREPGTIEEFAGWSRDRQAAALRIAAQACKSRFPRCGGIVLWMGHDSFPCSANTSVFDYHGGPKPAVDALRQVFTERRPG
jgi:beta-mannosidase